MSTYYLGRRNPFWVSPEGTAGYLSPESHTRYRTKHPKRGRVPKFMERQVRLEAPRMALPAGWAIVEVEVTERGRPVTHYRLHHRGRDTGKYARDWNKAVQIARRAVRKARRNPGLRTVAGPAFMESYHAFRRLAEYEGVPRGEILALWEKCTLGLMEAAGAAHLSRRNPRGRLHLQNLLVVWDTGPPIRSMRRGWAARIQAHTLQDAVVAAQIAMAKAMGVDRVVLGLAEQFGPLDAMFEATASPMQPGLDAAAIAPEASWKPETAALVKGRRSSPWQQYRLAKKASQNPSARQRKKAKQWTIYHADHGISPKQMTYIKGFLRKKAPQGFFIQQFRFPRGQGLGTVPNAMWGPVSGDAPVPESQVHYMDRAGRGWEDRMISRPPRPANFGQVIGVRKGNSFTLFTVYGGPLSPQNPADPGNQDVAGSKRFWKQHALSSHQWAAAK